MAIVGLARISSSCGFLLCRFEQVSRQKTNFASMESSASLRFAGVTHSENSV